MPLNDGERIGAYEIRGPLGAGGMGEVYRALDTGLGREVAVKILPPILAGDSERIARFDREARLLASLNHPNIATLFGFERGERTPFIVMELVEGETLAQRLKRGALPRDEQLEILQQIAEGLEAAHDSGVIHRDLKPANIKITPEGKVKLLDFGLAKALEGETGVRSDASLSPTLTAAATQRGEVMGTASYMSPEQARGKPVDRRTDIWAFGCVLYECLTGRLAYGGETISDTIALILQREPGWEALPADTPPRLVELLRRCFEKEARRRLRDIGEARLEIEKVRAGNLAPTLSSGPLPMASGGVVTGAVATSRTGFGWGIVMAALVAGLVTGAVAWSLSPWSGSGGTAGTGVIRFEVAPPPGIKMSSPKISPDGKVLVFYGELETPPKAALERVSLYLRPLDATEARRVEGSEGAFLSGFSPDGRWLAFAGPIRPGAAAWNLRKVPVDGSSPPVVVTDWSNDWTRDFLWLRDGDFVVFSSTNHLVRIASDGGAPPRETARLSLEGSGEVGTVDSGDVSLWGRLPGSSRVLVTLPSWEGRYHHEIHVLDTETGTLTRILQDGSSPRWSPTGHLVFTRDDTLLAVPFDAGTLELNGGPVSLATGLGLADPAAAAAPARLSENGTLVHTAGGRRGGRRALVVVDGKGEATPWSSDRRFFQDSLELSRDGRRLATTIMTEDLVFSVWISDVERPRLRLVGSMPGMDCQYPVWMPDGSQLLIRCGGRQGRNGIYVVDADGGGKPSLVVDLESSPLPTKATSVTPDGRWLMMDRAFGGVSNFVQVADLASKEPSKLRALAPEQALARQGRFSPDGKWFLYTALASGGVELYVRRFNGEDAPGPPILATVGEIGDPEWTPDPAAGRLEIRYHDAHQREYAVFVEGGEKAHVSDPVLVLDLSALEPPLVARATAPGGRMMGVQSDEDESVPTVAEVTVGWSEELKRLAPTGR